MEFLNVTVREALLSDLPAVLEIENLTFITKWGRNDFLYELSQNPLARFWVLELELKKDRLKSVVGFIVFYQSDDSATLCQIAVHPDLQHRHLASALMDEMIKNCFLDKIKTITLEVRKSNEKATKLYEKYGFRNVVVKPNYFPNGEDAFYMVKEMREDGVNFSDRI